MRLRRTSGSPICAFSSPDISSSPLPLPPPSYAALSRSDNPRDIPSDWGSDFDVYEFNASVRVGQLETTGGEAESKTGRVVVFPNYIQACLSSSRTLARFPLISSQLSQHRVSGLENPLLTEDGLPENAAVAATRKIVSVLVGVSPSAEAG
jgi:hypothetical protein